MSPALLPPRRPPRSTVTSDPAQFALPFAVEERRSGDRSPSADEIQKQLACSALEVRPANRLPENSSPVGDTDARPRRSATAKLPTVRSLIPEVRLLVSRKAAAEMLSISVRGVDYLIAAKRLSTRRIANRVLIPVEEVRKFARSDHPERMVG